MKSNLVWLMAMALVIAVLGGVLIYELGEKKRAVAAVEKQSAQFFLAYGVRLYEGLAQGDIETVKHNLAGTVIANALLYEKNYGRETNSKFATVLTKVDAMRAEFPGTQQK